MKNSKIRLSKSVTKGVRGFISQTKGPREPLELLGTILDLEFYNDIKIKIQKMELKYIVLFHYQNGFFFIFF